MRKQVRAGRTFLLMGLLLFGSVGLSSQAVPTSAPPSVAISESSNPELLSLVRQKRWSDVRTLAAALRDKNPKDPEPRYWLGIAQLQLHEPVEAVLALRSAEKLGLDSSLFHLGLGLAYYDLNQFYLFEQQMEKASQLDPGDSKPHYYLGLYQLTIRSDSAR